MRTLLCLGLVAVMAGCGVEVLTTTAIQGDLQARQLTAMDRQLSAAGETMARTRLRNALDTFNAEKGYYPLTFDSLVPDYLPSVPVKGDGTPFGYDPTTGKILDTPQDFDAPAPAGTAPANVAAPSANDPFAGLSDAQKIRRIQDAIAKYGPATGHYPATLQDLVPNYLPAVPRTAAGQAFQYNNQNGAIWAPGGAGGTQQAQRPAAGRPGGGAGVGGAGPMGEVMTGIGVQNQLNSMHQSGASSAGSYGRGKLGGAQQQHNAAQQKALDDLGF